eukprot:CAMPEP_0197575582 /NCGR_PEP_ID=MMETSP1326-20131121/934_1 /TAXON_ID=1155430 /ORGANISM="Genus nov. species nov., Strain RCC2288" /LENGTH=61 /DNA_ID=CAMNT_0043138381 /DNA_START=12 /DNA_END=197 /DNA_ORIENTATION=+
MTRRPPHRLSAASALATRHTPQKNYIRACGYPPELFPKKNFRRSVHQQAQASAPRHGPATG